MPPPLTSGLAAPGLTPAPPSAETFLPVRMQPARGLASSGADGDRGDRGHPGTAVHASGARVRVLPSQLCGHRLLFCSPVKMSWLFKVTHICL